MSQNSDFLAGVVSIGDAARKVERQIAQAQRIRRANDLRREARAYWLGCAFWAGIAALLTAAMIMAPSPDWVVLLGFVSGCCWLFAGFLMMGARSCRRESDRLYQ